MKFEKQLGPSNTIVRIDFERGEEITAEAGSMIAMSSDLKMETTTYKKGKGSILKGLKRMFAGESFFLNHYTAQGDESHVLLTSALPGDIQTLQLENKKLIVQASSFLAAESKIDVNSGWKGFKNFFSGESLFWLELSGSGCLALSAFGAIYEVDIDGEYTIDTGHIVAFEEGLDFRLSKAGTSWLHSFLGSEGIICRFNGKGKAYCQSHNPSTFGHSLTPFLSAKQR